MRMRAIWMTLALAAVVSGCGVGGGEEQVSPTDFYARHAVGDAPYSGADQPGQLPSRDVRLRPPAGPPAASGQPQPISPVDQEQLKLAVATTVPSTLRAEADLSATEPLTVASTEPELSPGEYMTLGMVVAEVNGTPIYANKILRRDAPLMRPWAKQNDANIFQIRVTDLVRQTIYELIKDELEVAAAERTLDSKDKDLAGRLTENWRQHEISEAGGSLEVARKRALESGEDLQEETDDIHRSFLQKLYYIRKVDPRVNVTADDERQYYQEHLASDFSTPDRADFYLLQTDITNLGDQQAKAKIDDLRGRALAGESIADLAQYNENSALRSQLSMQPGSFALKQVDAALWKLSPGQVSDVIQDSDNYYVIKMINLQKGGVQPFDSDAVQQAIYKTLYDDQVNTLRLEERVKLLDLHTYQFDEEKTIPEVVGMIMENYPRWSREP